MPAGDTGVHWGDPFGVPDAAAPSALAGPGNPAVVCFVGGNSDPESHGIAIQLIPSRGWIEVSSRGGLVGWIRFPPVTDDDQRFRVTLSLRGLAVSVGVLSLDDQRQLAAVNFADRLFYRNAHAWPDRRMGILTTGRRLSVGEVSYQQLAERHDLPEFLIRHRMYSEALDRIAVRLGSLGAELSPAERARFEYLRGLCLWRSGLEGRESARLAFFNASDQGDGETAFLAALAALEMELDHWLDAVNSTGTTPPEFPGIPLRRARGFATTDARLAQLAAMMGDKAHPVSTPVNTRAAQTLIQAARNEVLRDSPAFARYLFEEFSLCVGTLRSAAASGFPPGDPLREALRETLSTLGVSAAHRPELAGVLDSWPVLAGAGMPRAGVTSEQDTITCRSVAASLAAHAPVLLQHIDRARNTNPEAPPQDLVQPELVRPVLAGLWYGVLEDQALAPATGQDNPAIATRLAAIRALLPFGGLPLDFSARLENVMQVADRATPKEDRLAALQAISHWQQVTPKAPPAQVEDDFTSCGLDSPGCIDVETWVSIASILIHAESGDLTSAQSAAAVLASATANTPSAWYHRLAAAWRDFKPGIPSGR
jgi:hypothetical protein